MSNEKFKVKFGLAVGDTTLTVDAATGDIVTDGNLTLNNAQAEVDPTITAYSGTFAGNPGVLTWTGSTWTTAGISLTTNLASGGSDYPLNTPLSISCYEDASDTVFYMQSFRGRGTEASPEPVNNGDNIFSYQPFVFIGEWAGYEGQLGSLPAGFSYGGKLRQTNSTVTATDGQNGFVEFGYSLANTYWQIESAKNNDSNNHQEQTLLTFEGNQLRFQTLDTTDFFSNVDSNASIGVFDSGSNLKTYTFNANGYFQPQVGISTTTGDLILDSATNNVVVEAQLNGPSSGIFNIVASDHFNISSPNFVHFNKTPTSSAGISINPGGDSDNDDSLIYIQTNTSDGTKFSSANWTTYKTTDGINFTPTQSNELIGQFRFNGNAYTSTTPGSPTGPGAQIFVSATENWTSTANGTRMTFYVQKTGTTDSYPVFEANPAGATLQADSYTFRTAAASSVVIAELASSATTFNSNSISFEDSSGTPLTSSNINYTRTYGEVAYTNAAGFAIPAQNTIYTMPLDTTLNASGVTISGTGQVNINVAGWYKIIMSLQVTLTVSNQPGQIDFWLRKNGTDVANSKTQVDLLKDQKSVIAMDWLVNSDGNDYWEIVYVGTTTNYADIDFPTIAATTTPYVSPVAPALLVNVIPVGA